MMNNEEFKRPSPSSWDKSQMIMLLYVVSVGILPCLHKKNDGPRRSIYLEEKKKNEKKEADLEKLIH